MPATAPATTKDQQEYMIKNQKGEVVSTVLVSGTANATADMQQAAYRAGVAQEYVSTTAAAAVSPTVKVKK